MSELHPVQVIASDLAKAFAKQIAKAQHNNQSFFETQNFIELSAECMVVRELYLGQTTGVVYYKEKRICEITPYGFRQGADFFQSEFLGGLSERAYVINKELAASATTQLFETNYLPLYPIVGSIAQLKDTSLRIITVHHKDKEVIVVPIDGETTPEVTDVIKKGILKILATDAMTKDIDSLLV